MDSCPSVALDKLPVYHLLPILAVLLSCGHLPTRKWIEATHNTLNMPLSKLQVLMVVNHTKSGLAWSRAGTVSMLPTVIFQSICSTYQKIIFVVHLLNARGIRLHLSIAQRKQSHS